MSTLFDTRYYRVPKLLCSIVGLWPYQSQCQKKIILSLNMFILFSYIPPQIKRLYQVWGNDIDVMCMCMPPLVTLIVCVIKDVSIILFDSEIKMLLRQIETEWELTSEREEYQILVHYTLQGRKLCILYAIILCNGLVCFIVTPMIAPMLDIFLPLNETRTRTLGFDLDYGIDPQIYWFWMWLHTSVAGTVVIFNMIAADVMYVTFIIYGCCLFALASIEHLVYNASINIIHFGYTIFYVRLAYWTYRTFYPLDIAVFLAVILLSFRLVHQIEDGKSYIYKLEHMADLMKKHAISFENDHNYNTEYNSYRYEELPKRLKKETTVVRECILSHKKAIKCAQLLQYIYSYVLFYAASLSMIVMSISSVQLVSKLFKWAEMMMSITYIIGELIHLFFFSLMAQYILDQSEKIRESVYSSSWYNMPNKFRKDILFILMRSRTPCVLTIGKLLTMSLESFCSMLQTSMSYFTVLASFR